MPRGGTAASFSPNHRCAAAKVQKSPTLNAPPAAPPEEFVLKVTVIPSSRISVGFPVGGTGMSPVELLTPQVYPNSFTVAFVNLALLVPAPDARVAIGIKGVGIGLCYCCRWGKLWEIGISRRGICVEGRKSA